MWLHKYLLTTHSNEMKLWALPFIEWPMWNFKLIYGSQMFSFTYILVVSFNKMLYKGTDQELMELSNPSKMTNYSSGSDPLSSLEAQPQTWPLDTFNCQRSDSISKLSQDSWFFLAHSSWKWAFLAACMSSVVCPSVHLSYCLWTFTTGLVSTNLGSKHHWVEGIHVCLNESLHLFHHWVEGIHVNFV